LTECYVDQDSTCKLMSTSPPLSSTETTSDSQPSSIEWELRSLAKDNADLAQYLLAFLVRNGYRPSESARRAMAVRAAVVEWLDDYVRCRPAPLRDLAVRAVRSCLSHGCRGNVMYALRELRLPSRINNLVLIVNPL